MGTGPGANWAVMLGDWKLIGKSADTSGDDGGRVPITNELYHLKSDPGEKTNLADKEPELVARLRQLHETQLKD
jgi:arylsulfatase A-like enzyme